jgi:hypothetical protein
MVKSRRNTGSEAPLALAKSGVAAGLLQVLSLALRSNKRPAPTAIRNIIFPDDVSTCLPSRTWHSNEVI